MTDANLRERAKRVGEIVGHSVHEHAWQHFNPETATCEGCCAERAALVELEAAVAEEREGCALDAESFNCIDICPDEVADRIRARGQR